jgi:hypothetical protein
MEPQQLLAYFDIERTLHPESYVAADFQHEALVPSGDSKFDPMAAVHMDALFQNEKTADEGQGSGRMTVTLARTVPIGRH